MLRFLTDENFNNRIVRGLLRRNPPVFTAIPDPVGNMRTLMAGYIRRAWTDEAPATSESLAAAGGD